jgi:hypothetical protein
MSTSPHSVTIFLPPQARRESPEPEVSIFPVTSRVARTRRVRGAFGVAVFGARADCAPTNPIHWPEAASIRLTHPASPGIVLGVLGSSRFFPSVGPFCDLSFPPAVASSRVRFSTSYPALPPSAIPALRGGRDASIGSGTARGGSLPRSRTARSRRAARADREAANCKGDPLCGR